MCFDCLYIYVEISVYVLIFKMYIGCIVFFDVELIRLINKNCIERCYGVYFDGIKVMFDVGEYNIFMIVIKFNILLIMVNCILCLYDLVGVIYRNKKVVVFVELVYLKLSMKKKYE